MTICGNNRNPDDMKRVAIKALLNSWIDMVYYNIWYTLSMKSGKLKIIGTCVLSEISDLSTDTPWEEIELGNIPHPSILTKPNRYLCTSGSACGSLPTTSSQGWRYVEDFYNYRKDGDLIDRDRYLGSTDPNGNIVVMMVPKSDTPYHHIDPKNPPKIALPQKVIDIIRDEQ